MTFNADLFLAVQMQFNTGNITTSGTAMTLFACPLPPLPLIVNSPLPLVLEKNRNGREGSMWDLNSHCLLLT